jgi:hypothetical protein
VAVFFASSGQKFALHQRPGTGCKWGWSGAAGAASRKDEPELIAPAGAAFLDSACSGEVDPGSPNKNMRKKI